MSLTSALRPNPVIPSLVLPKSRRFAELPLGFPFLWSRQRPSTARRGGFVIPVINCILLIMGESERLPDLWDPVDASRGIWWP